MTSRPWLLPVFVFLVVWAMTTHGKYSASGDEPHYLIVTQSLIADGDIDLRNNYAANESMRFGVDHLEPGPHVRESLDGQLPVHDIGLSVALIPVYALATGMAELMSEPLLARFRMSRGLFAYSLITLSLLVLTATAAHLTRTALVIGGAPPRLATAIVLVAWLSPPVLSNAFLVFPEVLALLATAWIALRSTQTAKAPIPFSRWLPPLCLLGLLPWFHRKFAVYLAAMTVALLWRHRDHIKRLHASERLAAVGLLGLPLATLLLWTWWQWGNVGGALTVDRPPFSVDALRIGWAGMLVDRENGLWVWAPAYALLPLAFLLAGRTVRLWLLPVAALFVISAAHDQWWGGFSPAARFLIPVVPLFCVAAPALWRHGASRTVTSVTVLAQVAIAAFGWQMTRSLWPRGDGHNRIVGPLLSLVGGSESSLPALRIEPYTIGRALLILAVVLAINLSLWIVVRRYEARLPSDARDHVA